MEFLRKHRLEIFILLILVVLYFFSRLYSILSLPIFTDEAIYIRWAQIAKQDASWRFISLTDGKQPMFIWLMMISLRFVSDPLLAGRLVSVGAGFLTMIGLFFLGRELFKSRIIGIVSSMLYVIFPMSLVYDRMALYDSLVGTFAVWSLFLIVQLARNARLDIALILGMAMGGGTLTKTSGFFSIYLLPFSLLLFDMTKKGIGNRFVKWAFFATAAIAVAYGFYSILRLSPFFYIISEKNALFVYPFKEWIEHPFDFFINNWKAFWDWINRYFTWPFLILIPLSFIISKKFTKEKLVLFLWFIVPIIALGLFGKAIFPRFIFFMTLSLLPLLAFSLYSIYTKIKKLPFFVIFCCLVFILLLKTDFFILTDFTHAYIPVSDVQQYMTNWPAGGGIKKSIEFFEKEATKGKIYIATQGTFGLLPYALEIYLINNPNIKIEGYWPVGDEIPVKAIKESKKNPVYFIFYQPCDFCKYNGGIGKAPTSWNLKPVLQMESGVNSYTSIYRIE